jgi:hypothetical protein
MKPMSLKPLLFASVALPVILLPAYGALTTGECAEPAGQIVNVQLAKYSLRIPRENLFEDEIPWWIRMIPGLDTTGGDSKRYRISAEQVGKAIDGYQIRDGIIDEEVSGILWALTKEEVALENDPFLGEYGKAWLGTDSYSERIIEKESQTGLFRVQNKYKNLGWMYMKRDPREAGPLPKERSEYWVATCLEIKGIPKPESLRVNCNSSVRLYPDFAIDFSVSGQNISVIEQVREFLKAEVRCRIVDNGS